MGGWVAGKQQSEAAGLLAADGLPTTRHVWKTRELPIFAVWVSTFFFFFGPAWGWLQPARVKKSHSAGAATPSGS